MQHVRQNCVAEWTCTSGAPYPDPGNDVTLDVVVTAPGGQERRVPAFWAGDQTWGVRYAAPELGTHAWRTVCSDAGNPDLHDRRGTLEVLPYEGANPLHQHGRLRLASHGRHLEHADGTPFFWLGDTWWMGFTRRLPWPEGFRELAADRVAKGFTLVQIVAGLYPDMEPFDERGANEAGFPWEKDFSRLNPAYFDMVDLKVAHLVRVGLVPCIVGSWGYFLDFAGPEVLRRHWRNLIARYGAYPVVWCAAGEALMGYYVKKAPPQDPEAAKRATRAGWTEMVRAIRAMDPFGNPVTIHPTRFGHEQVDDATLLDVDMLQTGHSGYASLAPTVDSVEQALAHQPRRPVVVSEVNYEGIMESSREEVQRFAFWTTMLSGAAGHTYGANGIWQVNTREQPYGISPHGTSWGNLPWDEAYRLPGSGQLGLAKRLLERYPWWEFQPHLEWVEPHQTREKRISVYAAGVPGKVRVLFIPAETCWAAWGGNMTVKDLETGVRYRARYVDPKTGEEHDLGPVPASAEGQFTVPKPPVFQDWLLILEA
ncbi:MAG: DUF4038 domain-containing protein [Candidatus Latescibacterota bacterium]